MGVANSIANAVRPVFLFALGFFPFLNPLHTDPLPTFYSEWLAAALGLAVAGTALLRLSDAASIAVPRLAVLPMSLAAVALAHLASGHASHPDAALMHVLYLLLATLLIVVGRTIADLGGTADGLRGLAAGLAAGAAFQSAVILLQRGGVAWEWLHSPWMIGTWTGGALGQRNHLVDYLWLGIACLGYLIACKTLRPAIGFALVLTIAAASILPGSRSAFLYPATLAALAVLAARRERGSQGWRAAAWLFVLTIPMMLAVDRLAPQLLAVETQRAMTASERLAARELDPVRSGLLQVAWQAATERPLSGHGLGSAQAVTFAHADAWPANTPPVVAEHFHNLVAHWLVEFGVPVTLLAVGFLVWWGFGVLRGASSSEQWRSLAMLSVIGVHSLLEYPLWQTYFLVPAAIAGGALEARATSLPLPGRYRGFAWAGLLAGALLLGSLWHDYGRLERVAASTRPGSAPALVEFGLGEALALQRHSLLAPQATVAAAGAMGISREYLRDKLVLCDAALRITPTGDVVAKCSASAALAGRQSEARQLLQKAGRVYGPHPAWPSLQAAFPELGGLDQRR